MSLITWNTEKRKVSDLIPATYNPRQMTEKQAKDLTTSLERFNLADPIVINTDNTIIGGHQRINIYKANGKIDVEVDVRVPSRQLTPDEEKELNLRLNKNLGEWNIDELANFDEEFLKDVGFDSKELDRIFQLDVKPEDDDVPDTRPQTDIKLGDMFQLGEHRLLCGDCTVQANVERLMGGLKAQLIMSDPPYNVKYTGGSTNEKKRDDSYQDEWTDNQYTEWLMQIWKNGYEHSDSSSALLIWFASLKMRCILDAFEGAGWVARTLIVWNKLNAHYGGLGAQYKHRFEPLYYCHKNKQSPYFYGATNECTVWDCEQPHKNDLHPTMKPVELYERCVVNHSKRDDIVLEFFGGSGTTLIACEKLNRKCRMMEIDPIYCQVIIDRWEKFTGQKANRIDN